MDILISRADRVQILEFNRPGRKNAITSEMYGTLADALRAADRDVGIRATVILGKPEIFTAGNDLEDFLRHPPLTDNAPVQQFLWAISHAEKPIVAAVCGAAVGVGTTLLMHCDLVYAADNARFAMPFTGLGLCPEAASSVLLPYIAGYQRAAEKLLLGEFFDAEEARAMGLVNAVLPADQVVAHARSQAAKLAALPPASIRATKQLLRRHLMKPIEERMFEEGKLFREMLVAPEAREAFAAFFEKRRPDFSRFE